MTIRVFKVADIIDGKVVFSGMGKSRQSDTAAVLTNLHAAPDPDPSSAWKFDLIIGKGPGERRIELDLPPLLSKSQPHDAPIFLSNEKATSLIYFRDRLFLAERNILRESERTEVILRIKKAVYDEQEELSSLRAAVANLEAAIEFQKSGPRRDPIPEDVKILVWARDGGYCVRCGSKQDLHFDHIIPVSKGGGNSEANIQILCQFCNLLKSDKIGVP